MEKRGKSVGALRQKKAFKHHVVGLHVLAEDYPCILPVPSNDEGWVANHARVIMPGSRCAVSHLKEVSPRLIYESDDAGAEDEIAYRVDVRYLDKKQFALT